MSPDGEKFSNLHKYTSTVEVANSEQVAVTGRGNVLLQIHKHSEKTQLILENVLHVPKLGGNLLSVGKIEDSKSSLPMERER